MRWKWTNVPIPEGHLIGFILGAVLHLPVPMTFPGSRLVRHLVGWPLLAVGLLLAASAVRASGDIDLGTPDRLVTGGPYSFSRNPMYLAWTMIYLAALPLTGLLWPIALLPAVLLYTHFAAVLPEERRLERTFGDEYRRYLGQVRRYL